MLRLEKKETGWQSSEADKTGEEEVTENQKVLCFLCRKWAKVNDTIIVVGQSQARAHICMKHLN